MIGSWDVQVALMAALKAADVVPGDRIYDHISGAPEKPYIEIGDTQILSADVQDRDGADEYRTLHIWSKYRGQKEILEIGAAVREAVHGQNLAVSGRDFASVRVGDLRTLTDPDGLTQHGVMTIRIQHFGPKEP